MRFLLFTLSVLAIPGSASAAVKSHPIEYKHGATVLEGYLAWDDSAKEKRPGVVVCHDWTGHNAFARQRAEQLAHLGYVGFALDMYGKGVLIKDPKEASQRASVFKGDRKLTRERVTAGLHELLKQPQVDPERIAAIGYCFGGTCALELARSGADIEAVVSFHGDLTSPHPADAKNIRCKVLALHGADDPFVPPAQVAAFKDEMRQGNVNWQLIEYGDAVHSFTNPAAGSDKSRGTAYHPQADKRSWDAMRLLFNEVFVKQDTGKPRTTPPPKAKVPAHVLTVLEYVDKHKKAPEGFEGGRSFGNFEKVLPQKDKDGKAIKYQEWDVHAHMPGVNRGAERLITGSDGSAHYTDDHYKTFTKIR